MSAARLHFVNAAEVTFTVREAGECKCEDRLVAPPATVAPAVIELAVNIPSADIPTVAEQVGDESFVRYFILPSSQ